MHSIWLAKIPCSAGFCIVGKWSCLQRVWQTETDRQTDTQRETHDEQPHACADLAPFIIKMRVRARARTYALTHARTHAHTHTRTHTHTHTTNWWIERDGRMPALENRKGNRFQIISFYDFTDSLTTLRKSCRKIPFRLTNWSLVIWNSVTSQCGHFPAAIFSQTSRHWAGSLAWHRLPSWTLCFLKLLKFSQTFCWNVRSRARLPTRYFALFSNSFCCWDMGLICGRAYIYEKFSNMYLLMTQLDRPAITCAVDRKLHSNC